VINRNLPAAAAREFDVAIIGGGIQGVSLLQQAARRGLSACLFEARDFGGATSWNTLRILHGGVRYLQTLNLARFNQSTRARWRIARQFPRLVRPLSCLMPLYGQGIKRVSVMRLGLLVSDVLDPDRNAGLKEAVQLPAGKILDAAATRREFPRVRTEGLQGAACWSDYFMVSSERMLIERLHDASRRGAVAFNYAPVDEIVIERNTARGLRVRDRLTGQASTITASQVVNCAGPKLREFARDRGGDADKLFQPSLAFNLLLDVTLPDSYALAVAAPQPEAPVLFLLPQSGALLAGTLHLARPEATVEAKPTVTEITHFLDLLNAAVPGLGATPDRVRRVFAGLLPAAAPGQAGLARREVLFDHGALGGVHGLYSVSGVKFTTAGEVARRLLGLMGYADRRAEPIAELPLARATDILIDARRLWSTGEAELRAELRRIVRDESVQCLDDLVLRRSNWGVTELDLDRLRARVASFVDLPNKGDAPLYHPQQGT
jgi:glycerol-3-phosphate dehydrogenase